MRDFIAQLFTQDAKGHGAPSVLRRLAYATDHALATSGRYRTQLGLNTVRVQGKAEGGRMREMYGNRVWAMRRVLAVLIRHVDVLSQDICRNADKQFYGLRVDTLTDKTGMDQRRVERVIADLKALGLLQTWQRNEKQDDGSYRGLVAVRKLNLAALLGLVGHWAKGLGKAFAKAQAQAMTRRQAAASTAGAVVQQHLALRQKRVAADTPTPARPGAQRLGQIAQGLFGGRSPSAV